MTSQPHPAIVALHALILPPEDDDHSSRDQGFALLGALAIFASALPADAEYTFMDQEHDDFTHATDYGHDDQAKPLFDELVLDLQLTVWAIDDGLFFETNDGHMGPFASVLISKP